METITFNFTQQIGVPPKAVYHAFTNTLAIRQWWADGAVLNATEGGYFFMWWNDGYRMNGEFKKLEENQLIEFAWHGNYEPAATHVKLTLEASGDGTLLHVEHTKIGAGWGEKLIEGWKADWLEALARVTAWLEEGIDLRIARRPMLGIVPNGQITPDNAARYGLPEDASGSILSSLVPGMGAEAAGLQPDDVLHSINGVVLDGFPAFAKAIKGKIAGDTVEVSYYRDGESHTIQMELSARQMPDVPGDPKELSRQVAELYEQLDHELDEVFEGVTDEEAAHRPAEGEWSAKEVIAHLIDSERAGQIYNANLIAGNVMANFPGNLQVVLDSIVAAYPTLDDLRNLLRRTWAETTAMLAALPEEFLAHKGSYLNMGQGLLMGGYHPRSHYSQITEAIAASRKIPA